MKYLVIHSTLTACLLALSLNTCATDYIHLYLDADQTGAKASGIAIERGIRTALHEVDNKLAGQNVRLIIRDHHGSSVRSKKHLEEYLKDDKAIAVFSGLHSPPLLENLSYINENKILILDPWAAAGPITRYNKGENWVYRLSVDDSKAGGVIVESTIKEGFNKPYLLLEDTGWGKSNFKTMVKALKKNGLKPMGTAWFNWNLGKNHAKTILRKIAASGADSILLVANAHEGKIIAQALLDLNDEIKLPIRSHWGITGGDFPTVIHHDLRKKIDLKFLQTRFSFVSSKPTMFSDGVFNTAQEIWPDSLNSKEDLNAPTGFIHAYDLTRIMITALKDKLLTGNTAKDRVLLKTALENINTPVRGLIKTYNRPFQAYNVNTPDAHEALSVDDLVMAFYGNRNQIIIDRK